MSKNGRSTATISSSSSSWIPNSMKKTIVNIQEIAKKHSHEDIYAMLKECSMDPNETVQRLLHLDTFHQVKTKRGKKNEALKTTPVREDSRWKPKPIPNHHVPAPGPLPLTTSTDTGGWMSNSTRKENVGGGEEEERGFRNAHPPVLKKVDTLQPHHMEKPLPISVNGSRPVKMLNGNLGAGHDFKPDRIDTSPTKETSCANSQSLLTRIPKAGAEHAPSVSDPVLLLMGDSLIPTSAVGTKQEVRSEKIPTEASTHGPVDCDLGRPDSTSNSHPNQSVPQNVDISPTSSSMVETEVYKPESVSKELPATVNGHVPNSISAVKPFSPRGVGPLQGVEVNSKQAKVKFFQGQHVIIPDHIQVPDAVKNALSFGSINASFGVKGNHSKKDDFERLQSTAYIAPENLSSSCDKDALIPSMHAEHMDNKLPQPHLPDENSRIDARVSSSGHFRDQPKDGNFSAAGPPFPVAQTIPSYSFGFIPPMLANALARPEGFETQAHVSSSVSECSPTACSPSSTPPLTQSSGVGQACVSQQQIPVFRQPYPPNYIPYGHYFSSFYVPPTMHHQYYGHAGFPQPLPTSNIFLPPPTTTTTTTTTEAAIKATSAHFKSGGNQAPNGVPAGYGVYKSCQAAATSGNLSTSGDLIPTASKDNYIYSGQQNEGSTVWLPTTGRDPGSFPVNSFLGHFPPQGHHGPFAVYHTLQAMPTPAPSPSPGHPLVQQSQPVVGAVDSVGPPSIANAYQPPHINWNM